MADRHRVVVGLSHVREATSICMTAFFSDNRLIDGCPTLSGVSTCSQTIIEAAFFGKASCQNSFIRDVVQIMVAAATSAD